MKFYKIDDQIVISDKSLTVGTELTANTVDASQEASIATKGQNSRSESRHGKDGFIKTIIHPKKMK